jgi:hypothetical protein
MFAGAIISGVQYLAPLRYMPIGEGGQGDYEECYDTHDAEIKLECCTFWRDL